MLSASSKASTCSYSILKSNYAQSCPGRRSHQVKLFSYITCKAMKQRARRLTCGIPCLQAVSTAVDKIAQNTAALQKMVRKAFRDLGRDTAVRHTFIALLGCQSIMGP
jgi:hypothetical protein